MPEERAAPLRIILGGPALQLARDTYMQRLATLADHESLAEAAQGR